MLYRLFEMDISENTLNASVGSTCNMIAIKCEHNCVCYEPRCYLDKSRGTEYYYCIKSKEADSITYQDLINTLVKEGYDTRCVHNILTEFIISKSGAEAKPVWGTKWKEICL